jgi:hypothetical protein
MSRRSSLPVATTFPSAVAGLLEAVDLERTLSAREAARLKYELLLDRPTDAKERALLAARRRSRTVRSLAGTLCATEFVANAPHHVSRMRDQLPGAVCWHVHIPRTGGTRYVKQWLERGDVFVSLHLDRQDDGRAGWAGVAARLVGLREAVAESRPVLVSGHVALRTVYPYVRPSDRIVTTIREPVARAVSLHRFARRMCAGADVTGFPWSGDAFRRGAMEWRTMVAAAGLDPHGDFDLEAFLDAGLCPDGQYVASLALDDDLEDLGLFLRDAGVEVVRQESIPGAEPVVNGSAPAGRTVSGNPDLRWVERRFPIDLERHAQIVRCARGRARAARTPFAA